MAATKNQKNIAIAIVIVLTALIVAIAAKKISHAEKRSAIGTWSVIQQRHDKETRFAICLFTFDRWSN